jgi:hypothetical protein
MLADYHLSAAASIVMSFRLSGFATGQANTRPGQNHELPRVAPCTRSPTWTGERNLSRAAHLIVRPFAGDDACTLPPLGIIGSTISTLPSLSAVALKFAEV